jgi:hypothetical protein
MRYLAININYQLDQDWYCKCATVIDCYSYFDSLGSGHGPRTAIYDIETNKYLWVADDHMGYNERLNGIVQDAMKSRTAHL